MSIFLRRIPLLLLLVIVLLEITILMIMPNFFQVKNIITQNYFGPLLYEQGSKNLLRFDTDAFARAIEEENPRIKNVTVRKKLPSTLVVQSEKRTPLVKATDRDQHARFLADADGAVFKIAANNLHVPLIVTGRISLKEGIILNHPAEKTALSIVKLSQKSDIDLDKLIIEEKQILAMFGSIKVVFKTENVDADKLKALQFLVKRFTIEGKKPQKIDLRFDKPIVRF